MNCSACGTDQDEVDSGYCINPSCGARLDQPRQPDQPESSDKPERTGKSEPAAPVERRESAPAEGHDVSHRLDQLQRLDPTDEPGLPDQPEHAAPTAPTGSEATTPPPDRGAAAAPVVAGAAAPLPVAPRASAAHRAEPKPRPPRRRSATIAACGALVLALAAVVATWQLVSKPDVEQVAEPGTVIEPVSGSDGTMPPADSEPSPSGDASPTPTASDRPVAGDSPRTRPPATGGTASRPSNAVRFVVNGASKREARCPQGVTWSSDRAHGPAAVFDHKGRHCLAAGPVVDTAGDFTVSAWVKLGVRPSDLSMTAVSQDGTKQSGFYLQYSGFHRGWALNRMSADVMNPDGNATATSSAPVTLEWTHLTGTYHAGTRTIQVYVNGVPGTAATQNGAWRATGPLVIGRAMWNGERGNFVHGQVADVRVWQRTLSAQEVSGLPRAAPAAG